jgi:hypothetical protein
MGKTISKCVTTSFAALTFLVACGSDDGSSADSTPTTEAIAAPGTEPPANESPTTEPEPDQPPVAEPAATEVPTTEPTADDGSCLVGEWVVTEEQMNAFYTGLMSTLDAPFEISVVGSAPLTFAVHGTYQWTPEFTLSLTVAGQSGTGVTGGMISGDWTADDGVITTASDVNALTIEVTVGGLTFSGDDFANGLLNNSPINGVTYSCAGDTPVLDFNTADPTITVPITLTPA